MPALARVAGRHGLAIVEDCCQAHLATCGGQPVGSFGQAAAYSFYPTKNLGAIGDGGALTTADQEIAERARRLRNGGQSDRYHHPVLGVNSRLDEIQAAVLRARLPRLAGWTRRRRALAAAYRAALADRAEQVTVPPELDSGHVYHLFPVRIPGARTPVQQSLRARGVETLIHYPVPLPRQGAFAGYQPAACPHADRVCDELLSLPLYPALADGSVPQVAGALAEACAEFRAGHPS